MSDSSGFSRFFFVLVLAIIAHCLWMRRFAWRSQYDRATTLSVATGGVAIFLMTPVGTQIGIALHWSTGLWHVHYLLAHWLLLVGGACAVANFLTRLGDDHAVKSFFRVYVELPLALTLPLMLAAFALSRVNRQPADFLPSPSDAWLKAYWIIVCAMGLRLIACALHCLAILRRDQRHRVVADIYILGCLAGLVVIATQLGALFVPKLWGSMPPLVAGCVTVAIFACSATYSWHRRVHRSGE
ncbi:hypothetical protein OS122_23910 [Mycolicibacterium mucogenicum]|uniref:hypothetical protein n=1 Tax=Mycolicibacterium mucogenicum TaxID=56689 RepID=UPI00226A8F11|nr:hypothetical protein [Mycolicibacterium mucogenicum]MCX8563946.1 hypothetical protein [Mycolicibacterium mucogenicum]